MAVNTQFSIAVHILAGLGYRCGGDATSGRLASSVNTSPSFVRRVLAKLSKAGLVETTTGKTGTCRLGKKPEQISLLDIYHAVSAPKAFAIHSHPTEKSCPVSCHLKGSLEKALDKSQKALEKSLGQTNLAEIIADMKAQ